MQSSCALPYLKAHSTKSLIKPETSLKHKSNLFSPEKYNLKITTNLHISVLKSLLKNQCYVNLSHKSSHKLWEGCYFRLYFLISIHKLFCKKSYLILSYPILSEIAFSNILTAFFLDFSVT